jgi:hypothetical protein
VAQVGEHLPSKSEALSLNPSIEKKKSQQYKINKKTTKQKNAFGYFFFFLHYRNSQI